MVSSAMEGTRRCYWGRGGDDKTGTRHADSNNPMEKCYAPNDRQDYSIRISVHTWRMLKRILGMNERRKGGYRREDFTEEMGAEQGFGGWVGLGEAEKSFQTRL